ncbi:MAG: hypothetical protein J0M29_07105 [Chitinophagales bacterium]|nr:hypothetical protein [Chitinophagales bacterium]
MILKSIFIFALTTSLSSILPAQGDIACHFYAAKKRVFIEIFNNTQDTLELDWSTSCRQFWTKPVLNTDYLFRDDTLFLDISAIWTPTFSCGVIEYYIDGKRLSNEILPFTSFAFYINIPETTYVKDHINHIGILADPAYERMVSTKLKRNTIEMPIRQVVKASQADWE